VAASAFLLVGDTMGLVDGRRRFGGLIRFSPSKDPICPSYPIIAWDAADSRGSLRNIVEPSYPVGYIGSLYLLDGSGWPLSAPPSSDLLVAVFIVVTALLPTSDCRSVSTRRGVHFVFLALDLRAPGHCRLHCSRHSTVPSPSRRAGCTGWRSPHFGQHG